MSKTNKEYNRIYNRCLYDARKQLIEQHRAEFDRILSTRLISEGIVPRSLQSQHRGIIIEAMKGELQ